jgi:pheromone a factor receptor
VIAVSSGLNGMALTTDHSVYPAGIALAALSLLSLFLDAPAFIWHARNRNLAAASLILWIMILNLINLINAMIWPTDDIETWWPGYGLCDVEVRLFVGSSVALPGALACIMRGLANVLNTQAQVLVPSKRQRFRNVLFEVTLCIITPLSMMAIYYVAQDKRYYIWGISGCNQSVDYSWVGIVVVFLPAPLLMVLDLYYTCEFAVPFVTLQL